MTAGGVEALPVNPTVVAAAAAVVPGTAVFGCWVPVETEAHRKLYSLFAYAAVRRYASFVIYFQH